MISQAEFDDKAALPVGKLLCLAALGGLGISVSVALAYSWTAKLFSYPVKNLKELYIASFWVLAAGLLYPVVKNLGINPAASLRSLNVNKGRTLKLALKYFFLYLAILLSVLAVLFAVVILSDKTGASAQHTAFFFSNKGMDKDISYLNSVILLSPYRTFWYFISVCLLAPIVEEVFYRRLLFVGLRKKIPFAPSLIISSLIFGSMHSSLALATILGLYLGYVYEKEKNIFVNIALHSSINLLTSGIMMLLWHAKTILGA